MQNTATTMRCFFLSLVFLAVVMAGSPIAAHFPYNDLCG